MTTTPEQAAAEAWAEAEGWTHGSIGNYQREAALEGFECGVAWAREQDVRPNKAACGRIAELEAQVANWESEEIRKASCCADNEMRVKELEAALNSIIAKSHSWVITHETGAIQAPIHDGYRKIATEALMKEQTK